GLTEPWASDPDVGRGLRYPHRHDPPVVRREPRLLQHHRVRASLDGPNIAGDLRRRSTAISVARRRRDRAGPERSIRGRQHTRHDDHDPSRQHHYDPSVHDDYQHDTPSDHHDHEPAVRDEHDEARDDDHDPSRQHHHDPSVHHDYQHDTPSDHHDHEPA